MVLVVKNSVVKIAPKLNYDVLIENQEDGTVKATLLSLPECEGLGANKEEAVNNLVEIFQARKPEILTLEIASSENKFPLVEVTEMQNQEGNAWDLLEALTGTIEAPSDWSIQHNHYLYGTPKYDSEII